MQPNDSLEVSLRQVPPLVSNDSGGGGTTRWLGPEESQAFLHVRPVPATGDSHALVTRPVPPSLVRFLKNGRARSDG